MTAAMAGHPLDAFVLNDRHRGVPPGHNPLPSGDVAGQGWRPADGRMALPLLTIDLPAFAGNSAAVMALVRRFGIAIAPHAKTPMAPALARFLIEAGAWATSVADMRQAAVMLRAGLHRIVLANQIGGARAAGRLADLLSCFPQAEVYAFVDSAALVRALADAWHGRDDLPPLGMLIEVGQGRGGVRTAGEAEAVLAAMPDGGGRLRLAGVAVYEGTQLRPDEMETIAGVQALFGLAADAMRLARAHAGAEAALLLTAGSSSLFDLVIEAGLPIVQADGRATLLLRSGACFFSDHGNTQSRLDRLVARGKLGTALPASCGNPFQPAVRLWAEVLSRAEDGLAVCGLGLRDTSHDQGVPLPLQLWREGVPAGGLDGQLCVTKLNDQHAFLGMAPGLDVQIGDVVEFGIRHPCTCLDKHDVLYGLDAGGRVAAAFRTYFG